jgi:hypothetical protein
MWTSVEVKQVAVPIGLWATGMLVKDCIIQCPNVRFLAADEVGREAGRIMQRQTVELYNGFRPNLIDVGWMDEGEVDRIISTVTKDLEDGSKWELETLYEFVWAVKA